jgi:hypothetical protein
MSELLEALRREEGRFRGLEEALERLRRKVREGEELEGKVAELVGKVRGEELEALCSAVKEVLDCGDRRDRRHLPAAERMKLLWLKDWSPHPLDAVRTVRRRAEQLRRAVEALETLELPEPPPTTFSRDLDLEAELPLQEGIRRVRVVRVSLSVREDDPRELLIEFESKGKISGKAISCLLDLPFLMPVQKEVMGLIEEATGRYEQYARELEAFARRFAPEHSREILMASL